MASLSDVSRLIMCTARAAPTLTVIEEKALLARHQQYADAAALNDLAASNLRRVISVANSMRGYGLPLDDLVQEGCCGMVMAAQRYDLDRDVPFGAYARIWMKAEMQDFILRNWSIVRLAMGSDEQKMFFKMRQLRAKLSRDPDKTSAAVTGEIAMAFGVTIDDVEILRARMGQGDFSLNAPAFQDEDGGSEWGDFLADDAPQFDDMLDDQQCAGDLRTAMSGLDDQERLIIEERWLNDEIAPLNALSEWFGISVTKVRRIEVAAIKKLRAAMLAMRAAPNPVFA
ncbi:sigma-70 family RNA polymerase sigma factor [Lichenihabitans sp. PAMC28606]|uniref:sigma-70 family RNA polymerase sigma factor n=1 Tax=Lichenihabitans sp. PAMC28606 TaxID=2880932 RepID=UPI001D0A33B8|nr:sigma-70 family RNA polymerase sigma factor [Lichenihabitans sp. PAMC28606]UDL95490.1 sigma-70 family RNA polymerase sigma factor [Lichenihabitans sp. PAMC28606]